LVLDDYLIAIVGKTLFPGSDSVAPSGVHRGGDDGNERPGDRRSKRFSTFELLNLFQVKGGHEKTLADIIGQRLDLS
jgi:hypothetical protein